MSSDIPKGGPQFPNASKESLLCLTTDGALWPQLQYVIVPEDKLRTPQKSVVNISSRLLLTNRLFAALISAPKSSSERTTSRMTVWVIAMNSEAGIPLPQTSPIVITS